MRAAFLALLAVNVLFFAWSRWVDLPHVAASRDGLAQLPRLKLVDEARGKPTSRSIPAAMPGIFPADPGLRLATAP